MSKTDEVVVQVRTELQYDYDAVQSVIGGGSGSGIASTLDAKGSLSVYFIKDNGVFVAYQMHTSTGDSSPGWTVENTQFPATETAMTLRTASVDNSDIDVVAVGSKNNDLWILQTGVRFPIWVQYRNTTGQSVVDIQPTFDYNGVLRVAAVLSPANIYLIDLATNSWTLDQGAQVGVLDFAFASDFGTTENASGYGYLITGSSVTTSSGPGLAVITGGTYSAKQVVATGNYTSVSYVSLPYPNALPLVFAIEAQTQLGWYFQVGADGTFTKVSMFGQTKLVRLQAVLRKATAAAGCVDSSGNAIPSPSTWVEVFALDSGGNIWHVESSQTENLSLVYNNVYWSYYSISTWGDPALITSSMGGFVITSTSDGLAILLAIGQAGPLQLFVQDPNTTSWSFENIAVPDATTPSVTTKTVYYVEVSAFDGNMVPKSGLTAVISSIQYANINVNGHPVVIDPIRSYTANTNSLGKLCLTYDVPDSLAAPTVILWVEGMGLSDRIDVQGSGDIQQRFKTITSDDLKNATNQITGKPLLVNVDQPTLDEMAKALTGVMQVIDPGQQPQASEKLLPVLSRKYIHAKTPNHLAATRLSHLRSLGHIRGNSGRGVHIEFGHDNKIIATHMTADEAKKKIADLRAQADFTFLGINWGDLWNAIVEGVYVVVSVTIQAVKDAANAFINIVKDGVQYAWDGVVNFVQQAFNVVEGIFSQVKVFFQDLFGWLGYFLNWDDMKHTAESFKQLIVGFEQEGSNWLTQTLPEATDSFFKQCKQGLDTQFDTAKTYMNGVDLGSFDSFTGSSGLVQADKSDVDTSSDQPQLDSLPSTAMWLLNKILNAGGTNNAFSFTDSITPLAGFFASFSEAAEKAGLSTDFNAAVNSFADLFASFSDRGVADKTTFDIILDAVKSLVYVILDLVETLVLLFEKAAAEALKFFTEILDSPVDLPIISPIFKYITGTELTCINSVCYALAIPFTLLYKLITGETPFKNSTALHSAAEIRNLADKDALLISRGTLSLVNAPIDAFIDVLGVATDAGKLGLIADVRFLNFTSLLVPILNSALSYGKLQKSPVQITSWSVGTAAPILSIIWLCATGLRRGPRGHIIGQVLLGILGAAGIGVGIWWAIDPDDSTPKTKAIITSQFFGSLSNLCKPLRAVTQRVSEPTTLLAIGIAMPVIDFISGIGTGSALIQAGNYQSQVD